MPGGRPTKYDPDSHPHRVYRLGLLGLTDAELGLAFGVSHQTLANWYEAYPEFLDARARAREEADGHIAQSLYHRAKGYEHEAVKIFMPPGADEPVYAKYIERFPPDTAAASLWLRNRHPDKWKDRTEQVVAGDLNLHRVFSDTPLTEEDWAKQHGAKDVD